MEKWRWKFLLPPHYHKPLSAAKSALCHTSSYLNKHELYGAMGFNRNFNDFISKYVRPCEYPAVQDPTLNKDWIHSH